MEQDDLTHLADQLRRAHYEGYPYIRPWEKLGPREQGDWIRVAQEAFKWLVG